MKAFARSGRFRWVVLALALACIGALVLFSQRSRPVPFMMLRGPVKKPAPLRDFFSGWIPSTPGWSWAWRVEQAVFGKRKPVNIYAQVLEVSGPPELWLSKFLPEGPNFSATNGTQVWLLNANRCKRLGEQCKGETTVLFRPRISTSDGIDSQLFVGSSMKLKGMNQQVGLALNCFGRVHSTFTDLIFGCSYSEAITNPPASRDSSSGSNAISVRTNLDAALRLKVPKGSGFFMLDGGSSDRKDKRIGVLVDPP